MFRHVLTYITLRRSISAFERSVANYYEYILAERKKFLKRNLNAVYPDLKYKKKERMDIYSAERERDIKLRASNL